MCGIVMDSMCGRPAKRGNSIRSGSCTSAAIGRPPMSTSCRRMWMAAVYVSTKPMSRPMVVRESACGCRRVRVRARVS